ncbi:MAG: hypothetical protein QM811_02460 [Pirellulales bacterium]
MIGTATTQVAWTETGPTPLPANPGIPLGPTTPSNPGTPGTPAPATAPIRLTLNGPETAQVGQEVVFNLDVQNLSEREMTRLVIRDQFDEGLQFAAGENPVIRQLEPLPAGRKTSVRIPLRVLRPGRLCQTVIVTTPDGAQSTAQACVNGVAAGGVPGGGVGGINDLPKLTLNILSNRDRVMQMGDRVTYTFELINPTTETVRDIQVVASFDPELKPERSTPGIDTKLDPATGKLTWIIPELKPNSKQDPPLQVQTLPLDRPTQPNKPARIGAQALVNGQPIFQELNVEITTPRAATTTAGSKSQLGVTLITAGEQIRVGTVYEMALAIDNVGSAPDRNLQLTVTLPEQVSIKDSDITGAVETDHQRPHDHIRDDRRVKTDRRRTAAAGPHDTDPFADERRSRRDRRTARGHDQRSTTGRSRIQKDLPVLFQLGFLKLPLRATMRFVVLRHTGTPTYKPGVHWDLLCESPAGLRTWECQAPPFSMPTQLVRELPLHRPLYLDYEGPLDRDRGTVERVLAGTFEVLDESTDRFEITVTGDKANGTLRINRDRVAAEVWILEWRT